MAFLSGGVLERNASPPAIPTGLPHQEIKAVVDFSLERFQVRVDFRNQGPSRP